VEYQIALSPDLGLSPADFIVTWNETAECITVAQARHLSFNSTFYEPSLISGAVDLLIAVSTGIASNSLYDLIKRVLIKRGVHKHTHYVEVNKPDGTHILVIDTDER